MYELSYESTQKNMKTIKELEAEGVFPSPRSAGKHEGYYQALKDVLGLINELIEEQETIITMVEGSDSIINTAECIILKLEELKARISGKIPYRKNG